MRYWYDTEFYEDGHQIHLISIGIVAEDGREVYLENSDFDWRRVPVDHWLWDNVYPHMVGLEEAGATHAQIAQAVREFVCHNYNDFTKNQLYGYYVSYDHVALAQLFGTMVKMPKGMPWFSFDLKQMIEEDPHRLGNLADTVPHYGAEHNALEDARWNKLLYEHIIERSQGIY